MPINTPADHQPQTGEFSVGTFEEFSAVLTPATYEDYWPTLRSRDLDRLKGKLVRQITANDGKLIQDAIYKRGAPHQARHSLAILRMCLDWVAERGGSGIEASPVAGVKLIRLKPAEQSDNGYVPTPRELGELVWRLDGAEITQQARLAALLVTFTAQRIETVLSATKTDFEPVLDGALWNIPRHRMKAKRPHVVPLPPATWAVVRQAMAISGDSPWLFPQVRPRRAGGPCDGHISYHPVAEPMHPLDPHDQRRGFATHGQALLGQDPQHTAAILHHAEGRSGNTTQERYALHNGTHFKWGAMRRWENWLLRLAVEHAPQPGACLRTLPMPAPGPAASETAV